MKKLGLVTILFFTKFVLAQSYYTACTPLPASATAAEVNSYNTCVANNRASAQSSGTAAAQSFTISGSTVVQPSGASSEQNDIYNQNVNINTTTATAPLTQEQLDAVSVSDTGAAVALAQSMRANTEGETTYAVTAESAMTEGLSKLSLAGECASVSSSGCYNQRAELYATGAAYLLAQRQAQDQVAQHGQARSVACIAKNQISTEQDNCDSALDQALSSFTGNIVTTVSGITVTVNPAVTSSPLNSISYNSLTGACSPPSAPACLNLSRNATPPSSKLQQSVREILKQKYAGTKGVTVTAQSLYSTNKDGSISVKGGGAYAKNDFSDLNKLKAKGLSDAFAQNLMKNLTSITAATSSTNAATASVTAQSTTETSSTVITAATPEIKAAPVPTQFEEDTDTEREPASLKKKLGSEFIGVAKDDIFKIINRRYKSEEKDDYFY